jgi:predicted small lipoprotein YifL
MKAVIRATAALVLTLNLAACATYAEPMRLDPNAQIPEAGEKVE